MVSLDLFMFMAEEPSHLFGELVAPSTRDIAKAEGR